MAKAQNTTGLDNDSSMEKMLDRLLKVPAVFTLNMSEFSWRLERMKTVKSTLEEEVQTLEEATVKYEQDDEELVQALDLLTWFEYKIGSKQKALELNSKALALTNGKSHFSLGNRAHLMLCQGDLEQTRSCLDSLVQLREDVESGEDWAAVKAHQAYCYFRLGGLQNMSQAVTLYEEALKIKPNSHLWRLQAGMANKRLSHPNLQSKATRFDEDVKKGREETAINYFERVAEMSPNPRLKAYAYSHIASHSALKLDSADDVVSLCEKALSTHGNDPYVLLNCSKGLSRIGHASLALEILKQSPKRPSSHLLYQIGICSSLMAKKETRKPKREEYYNAAMASYRDALLANPLNFPAQYSLAMLLKIRNQYQEAMLEFKKLITRAMSSVETSFSLTQMKAYEQAALCQLKLCKDPAYLINLPDSVSELSLKEDAEFMLIKALEIGFNIQSPEDNKRYLKFSFHTLISLGKQNDSPQAFQLLSRALMVNEREKSLQVLNKLMGDVSRDSTFIIFSIKSYLGLKKYEEAYALLQISSARIEPCDVDEDLFKQVSLCTAWARLMQLTAWTAGARIFKTEFDNLRQRNHCLSTLSSPSEADVFPDEEEPLDVLIFYDDSGDGANGESKLSSICRKLQQAMASVFGLNVSCNMQACSAAGHLAALQLKEMQKAEVVLVVIGDEAMDGYFESVLNILLQLMERKEDNSRPARVLVAQTEACVKVPSTISKSKFTKMPLVGSTLISFETLEQRCDNKEAEFGSGDTRMADDTVRKYVEDIMVFFCHLIATDWPGRYRESQPE